jgi:hypothetical protein
MDVHILKLKYLIVENRKITPGLAVLAIIPAPGRLR